MSWWLRAEGAERVAVAPSLLAADAGRLAEEVAAVERAGADLLHVDVMDGHFVPNLTFGPHVVSALRRVTDLPLDCHLMVTDPEEYGPRFAAAGADVVSFHYELDLDHVALAGRLRAEGARPGIVVNPSTALDERLADRLGAFDLVLVMSVHPGFGGQAFDPVALPKLRTLSEWRAQRGLGLALEIDGGIGPSTAGAAIEAGADVLVSGSALFRSKDYSAAVRGLRAGGRPNPAGP